jgi:hypothetical protein
MQEGARGIFSMPEWVLDDRFFDNGIMPNNIWFRSDDSGLKDKIEDIFPDTNTIKTTPPQPRLLLVATSMTDGASATFDSTLPNSEVDSPIKKSILHMASAP